MKLLKKYTLKQSLIFLLLIFVLAFVFLSFSATYYIKNTQKTEIYLHEVQKLANKFSDLRYSYNKNLTEEVFLKDKNDEIENIILSINNLLEDLIHNKKTKNFDLNYEITKIKKDFEAYVATYKRINTLKDEIYNSNNGLEKDRVRIEKSILDGDDYISENYLGYFKTIQRHERLLFDGKISFKQFEQNYSKTLKSINKADPKNIYSKYVKSKFNDKIAEYINIVISKYSRKKEIGFTNDEGLNQEINEKYIIIISKNKELIEILKEKQNTQIRNYIISWLITSFSILLVLSLLSIYFISLIIKDFGQIKAALLKLAKGEINNLKISYKNKDVLEINDNLKKIEKHLTQKKEIIDKIKNKEENIDYKVENPNDKIANSLLELINNEQKRLEKVQEIETSESVQRYVANGLATIGQIMRTNTNNIKLLSNRVLNGVLEFLQAPQGAFYVYRNSKRKGDFLELVSSYAYGKEKIKNKNIKLNEGLIGSVAVEKKHVIFNELPEDYIYLSIGYGNITPKSLIIVPLLIEDKIYGIIEIASFSKFTKAQVEFLLKLANEIAVTISYVEINEKTAKLLEESKQQEENFIMEKKLLFMNKEEVDKISAERAETILELKKKLELKEKIILEKVEQIKKLKENK